MTGEKGPFAPGTVVDQYQVLRLVGRGGMGEVVLARDTELGRRVALKVIHPGLLRSDPQGTRFLYEARATARFNHPHIVTIFGVGRHEGIPYMALEYLEGHTLRRRMREAPLGERECVRVGLAIAEALRESHRHDIVHGDLKPRNVVIPTDGRIRVLDFGLARIVGAAPDAAAGEEDREVTRGSPQYMAPERWLGEEAGQASDVWALGAILYELLARRRPYDDPDLERLGSKIVASARPRAIDRIRSVRREFADLIEHCLRKDPRTRPDAASVAVRLRDLLAGTNPSRTREETPFRGLRPFSERHAHLFHGREGEVGAFLERMREGTVLPVVGASGVGKSSFVQAGVIPRLREQGRWVVIRVRPGRRPFVDLEAAFHDAADAAGGGGQTEEPSTASLHLSPGDLTRKAETEPEESREEEGLAAQLRREPHRLNVVLHDLAETAGGRVLLFVDQLEELYTLVDDEDLQRKFLEAVCSAADDPLSPVRAVFAIRDDFLGRLHQGDRVRAALAGVTVLQRPDTGAMEGILLRPLRALDYDTDDPELIPEMVEQVSDEPACLPLLQFTARLLWDRRDREARVIRRATYESLGGVAGALARHADGVLEGLPPRDVRAARTILLRMVNTDGTRRVQPASAVLEGGDRRARRVLGQLVDARLVTVRRGSASLDAESELELVHESLIHNWGRLARWIDRGREELAILEQLGQVAALWESRGRRDEELWHGEALHEARNVLERGGTEIPPQVSRFLRAATRKDMRLQRRRRILAMVGIGLLGAIAISSAAFAWFMADEEREMQRQKEAAVLQWELAEAQRAEAQREGASGAFQRGDSLEARAKLRMSLETEDSLLARALWWRIGEAPLVSSHDVGAFVYQLAYAPDGETLAVACQDHAVYLMDPSTGAMRILRGHGDQVSTVAFSPDGASLASGSWDAELRLWDVEAGTSVLLEGHGDRVTDVEFDPRGGTLASASNDGTIRLWPLAAPGTYRVLAEVDTRIGEIGYSPDGTLLAVSGDDGTVRVIGVDTGEQRALLTGHDSRVRGVQFSPDGRRMASRSADLTIRIWDVASGAEVAVLRGHSKQIYGSTFLPDSRHLVSSGADQTVRLWDTEGGEVARLLEGGDVVSRASTISPDGRYLAMGTYDKALRIWDIGIARANPRDVAGHSDAVYGAVFSHDDSELYTASLDTTIRRWDAETGEPLGAFGGHTNGVCGLALTPDGESLVSGSMDGTVRVWDLATGSELNVMTGHTALVWDVDVSPDGRLAASASTDKTVRVWDLSSGRQLERLEGHPSGVMTVTFDPTGRWLASAGLDDVVRLWDVAGGRLRDTLVGHQAEVIGVAFSPDGSRLATGSFDHTVRLWDLASGHSEVLGEHDGRVHWLGYSPRGDQVGSSCADGTARVWNVDGSGYLELRGHRNETNAIRFSHRGDRVATGGDDGTVRVWDAHTGRPRWRGTAVIGDPPLLLDHRGWHSPTSREVLAPPAPGSAWVGALQERAVLARGGSRASPLCVLTDAGDLELWSPADDRRSGVISLDAVDEVEAVTTGCVTRVGGEVVLHALDGSTRLLTGDGRAIAVEGDEILVATDDVFGIHALTGVEVSSRPIGPGTSALTRSGEWLVLGFQDGSIERHPLQVASQRTALPFTETPSSAVVRLLAAPPGIVAAGYANGQVGLWEVASGTLLRTEQLHGPVAHLRMTDGLLIALSSLGDSLSWDLAELSMDRCELLHQVWDEVPVVWSGGVAVVREPPGDHPCRLP